jgi:hypothetical protein
MITDLSRLDLASTGDRDAHQKRRINLADIARTTADAIRAAHPNREIA